MSEEELANDFRNYLDSELPANNPMSLAVSDLHMGATGGHSNLVEMLLEKLHAAPPSNLKVIFLIGDIVDLICNDLDIICQENARIFECMDLIRQKEIRVIHVLGNHDIPVTKLFWFIDRSKKRRKAFVRNLSKSLNKALNPNDYCNIATMEVKDGSWVVYLHDKAKEIGRKPVGTIEIAPVQVAGSAPHFLMAHGYQFFPAFTRFGAPFWAMCMNFSNSTKRWVDSVMNQFGPDLVDNLDKFLEELREDHEEISSKKSKERAKKLIQARDGWDKKRAEMNKENRDEKIRYYLENNKLSQITKVIYGHTHEPEINDTGDILNTGGWKLRRPSIVEIYRDGGVKLRNF
ncbi:MAG: metallophosphoesterase [Candidatus Hodarchaeota archaeon]